MHAHRSLSLCPFCEHRSPSGSKFCNQCGAALHLQPCPHCGALNDVTQVRDCARCHQTLDPLEAEPPDEAPPLAGTLAPLASRALSAPAAAGRAEWLLASELPPAPPPARRWPWLLGLGLVLPALAGLTGYRLALQQQAGVMAAPPPAAASAVAPTTAQQRPAPEPVAPPLARPQTAEPAPLSGAVAGALPAAATASSPQVRPAVPARASPLAREAALPVVATPSPSRPCTEALAALGLCSPNTDPNPPPSARKP